MSCKRAGADAGFTLIEVVVTLAVIAVLLLSLGSLIHAAVRGSQAIDDHLVLIETVRAIDAGLPSRDALTIGKLAGERDGQHWRVDVTPFSGVLDATVKTPWVPLTATITVQTPGGTSLQVTTVRLGRKS